MRAVIFACFVSCGGMVVPDPPPPPAPHDYQVGCSIYFATNIWHSSTATMVTEPGYADGPTFTHDGRLFVTLTNADLDNPATTHELAFVTTTGATVRTIPFLGHVGVRGDGQRLTLVDTTGALMTYDVVGTLGSPIATKVDGRALYAPDDTTLVFARGGQIVTMGDDGTNEEVLVPADAEGPSFSWDGKQVVYVRSRTDVNVVDRATHETRTLFTASAPQHVWTAALTPDGAYVIFVLGALYAPLSIVREEIATASVDVLVDKFKSILISGEPGFELSVAPDVTSK